MKTTSKYLIYFGILCLISFYYLSKEFLPSSLQSLRRMYNRVLQDSGDVSLPLNSFTISDLFTVNYELNKKKGTITMAIQFNQPNQYFSIGFGTRMSKSDMWVFEIVNNAITSEDRYSPGYSTPGLDTSYGGKQDLTLLGYEITNTYSLVKVKRALNTGDKYDYTISEGPIHLMWATASNPRLAYHGSDYGVVAVNLYASSDDKLAAPIIESAEILDDGSPNYTEKVHTIVSLVAWGLVADIGIIFMRLMKGRNVGWGPFSLSAHMIHTLIMTSVIVMSLIVTATVIQEMADPMLGDNAKKFHYICGLVLIALMAITLLTGVIHYASIWQRRKNIGFRIKISKWAHIFLGVSLYLLVKANFVTGAMIYGNKALKRAVYTYLGVLFAVHLIVQAFISYCNHYTNNVSALVESSKPSKYLANPSLLKAINDGMPREKLLKDFPNIIWVVLGNKVYNLTHFSHPGGNFMVQAVRGREVGRYFFGNYALEGCNVSPHKHSALAISQLKQYYMGDITNSESILLYNPPESVKDFTPLVAESQVWKITAVTSITPTTSEVIFSAKNSEIMTKTLGTTLLSLGRHFKLSFHHGSAVGRLYTTALALTPMNTTFRKNLYDYFDRVMTNEVPPTFIYDPEYINHQNTLPFFIKNYANSKKGLSRAIHDMALDDPKNSFHIQGPLGRGLELTNSSTGSYAIICAGTGILPFVDFLNLFLLKNIYELTKKKAGAAAAQQMNVLNIPFDSMMNGMNITLVASFAENEVLGADIISKLAEISEKYGLNNFKALIRGYDGPYITMVKERFNKALIAKELGANYERYYVVGPPEMNHTVPKALRELGVPNSKIDLV